MSIEVKMPALSPTMEKGTLAKWLVKEGDAIKAGDVIAEIETDKATMEFEAADEGRIAKIIIPEGTDEVAVGTVIALIGDRAEVTQEREEVPVALVAAEAHAIAGPAPEPAPTAPPLQPRHDPVPSTPRAPLANNVSPLAARIAKAKGIDLTAISGTGPGGRIVKADLGLPQLGAQTFKPQQTAAPIAPAAKVYDIPDAPHEFAKLSNMRKTIARRLTESKQQVPHIYLTVEITLDPLLKLRAELNEALVHHGIKLSVNDMIIKALALALMAVPACNAQFASDQIVQFKRADISVAVAIPGGLVTPVITDAANKRLSQIAAEMKDLTARAREGKLQPHEYQGGTASLSNLGMYGIKQFDAVINAPQAMILAVGAGEKRPIVQGEDIEIATVITATGSFDHRVVDGADAAALLQTFRRLVEQPLELVC